MLRLAQAYSMVVSTEVSTRLADEGATAMAESVAEYESGVISSISPEYPKGDNKGGRAWCGDPFKRPDDVGTKSTAIVRTSRGI